MSEIARSVAETPKQLSLDMRIGGTKDRPAPFGVSSRGRSCRLLYVVGQLEPGGLERQLHYLLRVMNREVYRPAVAVWNYREDHPYVRQIRDLGVPLYSFGATQSRLSKLRAFGDLVRQLDPEVVHSYSFYTNFAAYWAALGTTRVAVGSIRGDFSRDVRESGPYLGRLSAFRPQHQICNSYCAAETVRYSRSPFVPKRLHVVRNGIDLKHFRSLPLDVAGPARILGIGYLVPVKRWDRLLLAAAELKRRGLDFDMRVAGDGPQRNALEQQAKDLGLAGQVHFIGHRDDIHGLLAEATCLVHTATSEGCPNAVVEAMACGRAVVAMDAGDIPSLVEDGRTGFVVPQGDIAILVERLAHLITARDKSRSMGKAARVKAEREFGLDRLMSQTFSAYEAAGWRRI